MPLMRYGLAIWLAGVINKPGIVASDARVDYRATVDAEQKYMWVFRFIIVIAAVGLGWRDPLTDIFDDPGALANRSRRECSKSLNRRRADFKEWFSHGCQASPLL